MADGRPPDSHKTKPLVQRTVFVTSEAPRSSLAAPAKPKTADFGSCFAHQRILRIGLKENP